MNVRLIQELEHQARLRRSLVQRVSDTLVRRVGSFAFVVVQIALLVMWLLINTGKVPSVSPFDPFPFGALAVALAAQGLVLSIFVLISQNAMMRDADRRAHLDLQISLLTEQSATRMLVMLRRICLHLGLPEDANDPETATLAEPTDVEKIADEIEGVLPKP